MASLALRRRPNALAKMRAGLTSYRLISRPLWHVLNHFGDLLAVLLGYLDRRSAVHFEALVYRHFILSTAPPGVLASAILLNVLRHVERLGCDAS